MINSRHYALLFVILTLCHDAILDDTLMEMTVETGEQELMDQIDESASEEGRTLRERRDGGYGGYSGGYSGGYGNYGCHCPYQQCDTGSDLLLYFAAGTLLGLLFSLLQAPAMMMMAPATGRRHDGQSSYNWAQIPHMISNDIAPLAKDLMDVYSFSQHEPACGRRWLCEVTQKAMKQGGLQGRMSSFASVAVSWMMEDMMPFLENLTGDQNDLDCSLLAPSCPAFVKNN